MQKNLLQFIRQPIFHLRKLRTACGMACSRYEYVKSYEQDDSILPNVWIVVRVDGKGFHEFAKAHDFEKPNDASALNLMNNAAVAVMQQFRDIMLAYGQSDEYSFVFRRETNIFGRRAAKLLSCVTSLFSSAYVMHWTQWRPQQQLAYPPSFDGRVVLYPSDQNLRDYLSWRQADVHVNNLYNTAFWNLVLQAGLSNQEAEAELRGSFSADKNELLFTRFGINYNKLPVMFRKGTTLLRKRVSVAGGVAEAAEKLVRRQLIVPLHVDMIREQFWKQHTELLAPKYTPGEHNFEESEELPVLLTKQMAGLTIATKVTDRQEQIS